MKKHMKILFVMAHPYLPQLIGGMQVTTDNLCRYLSAKGHQVAILCGLSPKGVFAWKARVRQQINKRIFGHKVARDKLLGYPVWRTWFPSEAIEHVAKEEQPDLIVVMTGKLVPIVLAAKSTGIPILVQLHDVLFHLHDGAFEDLGGISCIANSRFTADKYHAAYGINSDIIYPLISHDKYRTETTRENITFINPHPEKGRDIALEIARLCPEIPFSFVESWGLSPEHRTELAQKLSVLPNVTLLSAQQDMRKVYGRCKILLAPSTVEESYGRVAAEAQISGIPVVASMRGGLPEAVGPGGVLLDPDGPIDDWIETVRKLWNDDLHYNELSRLAFAHAQRAEISTAHQLGAYEKALRAACIQEGNG